MTDNVNHTQRYIRGVRRWCGDRQTNFERENIKIISKLCRFLRAIGIMNHGGLDVGYVHFLMNKSQVPNRVCFKYREFVN